MDTIKTLHGEINLPAFMPDATYGSIRSVSFDDAKKAGVEEIVTTTLHLEQKIGSSYIQKLGGLHKFFNWDRPILTDSGGWQVFSLINSKRKFKKRESITEKNLISEVGCSFLNEDTGKYSLLTPESSIQIQQNLGSDIMTVLDNPILGNASLKDRKECVRINTSWAKRAKNKFDGVVGAGCDQHLRPLLGCVIQGGDDFKLRKQSAEELLELDFDIYNFGGIPMMSDITWLNENTSGFYHEMLHYVSSLIPENKIKYAMGVGQPEDIAYCVSVGWQLFDTVLPTRNARHGYLYVSEGIGDVTKGSVIDLQNKDEVLPTRCYYDILHLRSERYKFDDKPVDENCDCECCRTTSRAYLRHLIRIKESSGLRLATIHNLHFYAKWMEKIRHIINGKT